MQTSNTNTPSQAALAAAHEVLFNLYGSNLVANQNQKFYAEIIDRHLAHLTASLTETKQRVEDEWRETARWRARADEIQVSLARAEADLTDKSREIALLRASDQKNQEICLEVMGERNAANKEIERLKADLAQSQAREASLAAIVELMGGTLTKIQWELGDGNPGICDTVWMQRDSNITMLELIQHTQEAAIARHQAASALPASAESAVDGGVK